jgi:hypothetical protein
MDRYSQMIKMEMRCSMGLDGWRREMMRTKRGSVILRSKITSGERLKMGIMGRTRRNNVLRRNNLTWYKCTSRQ